MSVKRSVSAEARKVRRHQPEAQDSLQTLLSRIGDVIDRERIESALRSRASNDGLQEPDIDVLVRYLSSRVVELEKENYRLKALQKHADQDAAEDAHYEKYRTLVGTISHGIQEVDIDGRIIFANKSLHRIYGYNNGELLGRQIFELAASEEDRRKLRDYMAALHDGQILPVPYECKSLTKDGQVIDVTVHWNYKRNRAGKVTGLILIVTDITEHKKAEESLRENEEKFRRVFDQSPIGAAIVGLDYRYLRVNSQFCTITGYSEEELLSKTVVDITHPDDAERDVTQTSLLAQGKAEQFLTDKRYVHKNGRIVWARVHTRVVRDGAGGPLYFLPLIEDITDRKRAEDELLFKNALLEAESETSNEGILVVSEDGRIVSYNKRFMRMWHAPQSLMNAGNDQKLLEYVVEQLAEPDKFLDKIHYLYEHRNAKSTDHVRFKDGRIFERHSASLVGSNGLYYGRIWYFRDVTAQKRAEQKILKLNEELEQRVAERTARLAREHRRLIQEIEDRKSLEKEILTISEREKRSFGQELHDSVGQQLTGVAFMTRALAQDIAEKMPQEAASADEIARYVNKALEKTRSLARGLHPVDLTAGSLASALQDLAAGMEQLFDVRCICRFDSDIRINDNSVAVHVYRIVQEAVTNAVKHGKAENIFIRLAAFGDKSVLTVQNDGEDFPEVMTRSTGMGLQIMGHRVEMIDGSLDIRRGDNGGTIVTCVLPNKADTEP
jgi:PAS domain S-box-containing protein